jgi:DNA-binding MarR family transcriptional regulator
MARTAKAEELPQLMFEMGRLLKREISREGEALSYLDVETLRYIQENTNERAHGGASPSMREVAVYLMIAPPSATALIDGLVKGGMLERTSDAKDRRIVRLALSKKGSTFLEKTMHARAKAFTRVIAHLSPKDCDELARILGVITRKS